jgi:hypothetical protein
MAPEMLDRIEASLLLGALGDSLGGRSSEEASPSPSGEIRRTAGAKATAIAKTI